MIHGAVADPLAVLLLTVPSVATPCCVSMARPSTWGSDIVEQPVSQETFILYVWSVPLRVAGTLISIVS